MAGTWTRAGGIVGVTQTPHSQHSVDGYFLTFTVLDRSRNKEDVCTWACRPGGNKPVISDVLTRKIEGTSWLVVEWSHSESHQVVAHFGDLADTFL